MPTDITIAECLLLQECGYEVVLGDGNAQAIKYKGKAPTGE